MIRLPKKKEYTVGIMTGSFHTDYSYRIADSVCDALEAVDADVHIVLMQAMDAKRYLDFTTSADESFDRHYYSMFEYGKYIGFDLLIVSFGTISAVSSSMSIKDFFAPFAGIPVIVLEDDTNVDDGISVVVDNYKGMYDLLRHLIREHGMSNILFVSGPKSVPDAAMRLKAYRDAMEDNGRLASEDMIAYGDFTDHVDGLIEELLDRNPGAQAVCCANDEMAESAYRVLKKRGLVPGRDVAVTGFDDSGGAAYMDPPLTTVRQDFEKVAESVGQLVKQLIGGKTIASAKIPARVVIRESCGCIEPGRDDAMRAERQRFTEDRLRMKKMQTKSIVSSLLLRSLFSGKYESREFFERFGKVLREAGADRAFVCLTERPVKVGGVSGYFLPDTLKTMLTVTPDGIDARSFEDGERMTKEELSGMLTGSVRNDRQLAVFPLFYMDEHYGALFVELDRDDMLFYYTLSLELGTGLCFLRMELENEAINRTLKNQNKSLEYSASHDSLTNCLNRERVMREAKGILKRQGGDSEYIVAIADIDHLKQINDTFGHLEGDAVIIKAAGLLREALPKGGIIGRLGGDEFMCFFPESASDKTMFFKNEVKRLCDDYNTSSGKPYYLTITVGYHSFNKDDGIPFRDLFRMADKQLFIDKKIREEDIGEKDDSIIRVKTTPLLRYVDQTEEIRSLSAPQLKDIIKAGAYRENLLMNYKLIGDLANDNESILNENLYPFLDKDEDFTSKEKEDMLDFAHAMEKTERGEYLDTTLACRQGLYLLAEGDASGDDELVIEALSEMIGAAKIKLQTTAALLPVSDICGKYYEIAVSAADRLMGYVEKERFRTLSDDAKSIVLANLPNVMSIERLKACRKDPVDQEGMTEMMSRMLAVGRDPFYREQVESYNWDQHECAMLETILSFAYYDDEYKGESVIRLMEECAGKLRGLYESEEARIRPRFNNKILQVVMYKNAYLSGDLEKADYKQKLIGLVKVGLRFDQSRKGMIARLYAFLEYMRLIDKGSVSEEEAANLKEFYMMLIPYAGEAAKLDTSALLFAYFALFFNNFVELPGMMSLEDMGLMLIASVHPPTYVHSLTVASLTEVLTRHLLERRPELFVDMPGIMDVDDVKAKKAEIVKFAHSAARLHDFGKLMVIENILTYGRDLMEEEKEIIEVHPAIGAFYLSRFQASRDYADVARGHHRWFDNKGGYPDDFDLEKSPYKTIVSIVACSDCLDAATDTIGRSYKRGKTLEEMVGELREGSGKRFAPYVVDLLSDDAILKELGDILESDRDNNYKETYFALKKYEQG